MPSPARIEIHPQDGPIWKIPAGYFKFPNIVREVRRMWIQAAMTEEGRLERYPRLTRPRRNVDELAKHIFFLLPRAITDNFEVLVLDEPAFVLHLYHMAVPADERVERVESREEAFEKMAHAKPGLHVEYGKFFFYSGKDHDFVVGGGRHEWLGLEIEAKGRSRFFDYIQDHPDEVVIMMSNFDIIHSQIFKTLLHINGGIFEVIVTVHVLARLLLDYSVPGVNRNFLMKRAHELAEERYDYMIPAIEQLHTRRRGYYNRFINTNLDFDPNLRGGFYDHIDRSGRS